VKLNGKVAIVGNGYVGAGMLKLFPDAFVIDPPKGLGLDCVDADGADLAIVCVPTAMRPDGRCDTSKVEEVVRNCKAKAILVKSTVTPGTTSRLHSETRKTIVFSPEYMGESQYWTPSQFPSPTDSRGHGFVILGGHDYECSIVADLLMPVLGPATRFRFMRSTEAELVKYFENAYFAMKVTFANEMRRIAEIEGVNYHVVREGWLDDPRVGPMHTAAFAKAPGFGGKCLPKDIMALAMHCRDIGSPSVLLESVIQSNKVTS
jgi:UDPglucose 6-dehydrogenase